MTNPSGATTLLHVGPSTPPPTEAVPTYWQMIAKQFYRPFMTKLAIGFAVLVVLCAVFVPFIANGSPYYIEMKTATGWHAYFPLFADLTDMDLTILWTFLSVLVFMVVVRRTRRLYSDQRAAVRFRWIAGLLVVAGLVAAALFIFRSDRLDPLVYRDLVANQGPQSTVRNAWFPPLRWGYADQEPLAADLINKPPSRRHLMGTDIVGRDTLSRLIWSTRAVLGVGLVAELISTVLGLFYGALMGYFVGAVDMLGMRFVEMVEAIPTLFLIIIFVAIFGRQMALIMMIIGLTGWTGVARFVRAEFLRIRRAEFVQAAVASGLPLRSILFRHIMPNALSSVLVVITFGVASAIFAESTLSFLGLGLEPPTPSWGVMLNEAGNPGEIFRPWLALGPGFLIFLAIFSCNIIGEGLRDALDPRLNKME